MNYYPEPDILQEWQILEFPKLTTILVCKCKRYQGCMCRRRLPVIYLWDCPSTYWIWQYIYEGKLKDKYNIQAIDICECGRPNMCGKARGHTIGAEYIF